MYIASQEILLYTSHLKKPLCVRNMHSLSAYAIIHMYVCMYTIPALSCSGSSQSDIQFDHIQANPAASSGSPSVSRHHNPPWFGKLSGHVRICMYVCIYVYLYVCHHNPPWFGKLSGHVRICIYVCIYVCMYVCMCAASSRR